MNYPKTFASDRTWLGLTIEMRSPVSRAVRSARARRCTSTGNTRCPDAWGGAHPPDGTRRRRSPRCSGRLPTRRHRGIARVCPPVPRRHARPKGWSSRCSRSPARQGSPCGSRHQPRPPPTGRTTGRSDRLRGARRPIPRSIRASGRSAEPFTELRGSRPTAAGQTASRLTGDASDKDSHRFSTFSSCQRFLSP